MRHRTPHWGKLIADSFKLGLDANRVIALRLAKLAQGGRAAGDESRAMVEEKLKAAFDAQIAAATSVATGNAHLAPKRALSVYKKRVRRNLQRLGK
jgi:hypothetical protein